jgi:hypothetical protein
MTNLFGKPCLRDLFLQAYLVTPLGCFSPFLWWFQVNYLATPQTRRRFNNPSLSFRRKPPLNSHVVKSLFGKSLPLRIMSTSHMATTNPTNNQRQWSSTLFRSLDMSAIPGYPRQMPPKYEKWLPKFTSTDAISVEEHMSNFWAFFHLHPISDDAKDLVMKLFSATLYDASRHWYLILLDGSIKTMDTLEEAFLKRWSIKEDPNMLLTRLNNLAKYENDSIQEFHTRFKTLLQRIPASHHLKDDYLVHIYTRSFNGQIGYLLRDKNP